MSRQSWAWREALGLLLTVAAVNAVGAAPALVFGADTGWVPKPWFYPPEYLFGVVWTLLFTLKGIAIYLIVREGIANRAVRRALYLFVFQFAVNVLWTPVFFGLQRPDLGLVVIVILFGAILLTMRAFGRVDRRAAALLVPYLVWVGFATVLNTAIWRAMA